MQHLRIAAFCLIVAAALIALPNAVAATHDDLRRGIRIQPARRQASGSSSPSSSSSASSTAATAGVGDAQNVTGAASGGSKSTSSYINWQLPDTFVQCQPALISFSAVFGAKDEDALGGTLKKAISNTWINLRIRPTTGNEEGISEDLSSNATSWSWAAVNFPEGTNFEVLISALTNITLGNTTSSSKGSSNSKDKKTNNLAVSNAKDDISPVVIARAFARSIVVASPTNDSTCLGTTTASNGTDASTFGGSHSGSLAGPAGGARGDASGGSRKKNGDRTVIIVAAFLGGLGGLFIALVGALAWHKRKDQRRLRGVAEAGQGGYSHAIQMARRSGAFATDNSLPRPMSQGSGLAGAAGSTGGRGGARSSAVPLWDGGYRDGPSAGWGYMASLVPGLAPQAPPAFTSPNSSPVDGTFAALRGRRGGRNRLLATNRRQEEGEEDLPSYGKSEAEVRDLPSYEAGFLAGLAALQQQQLRGRAGYEAAPGGEPTAYEDATAASHGANTTGFTDERSGLLATVAEERSSLYSNDGASSGSLGRSNSNATTSTTGFQAPPPAEVGRSVTMSNVDRQQRGSGSSGGPRRNDSTSSATSAGSSTGSAAWRLDDRYSQQPRLPPIQTSGQGFTHHREDSDNSGDHTATATVMRSPFDDDSAARGHRHGHSAITFLDNHHDDVNAGTATPTATTAYEARAILDGMGDGDGNGRGSMAARRRSRGGSQSILGGFSGLSDE